MKLTKLGIKMKFNKYMAVFLCLIIQNVSANLKEKETRFHDLTKINSTEFNNKTKEEKKNIVVSTHWLLANKEKLTNNLARKHVDLSAYINQNKGANITTIGPDPACDASYADLPAIISTANSGDELHIASGHYASSSAHFDIVKSLTIIGGYSQNCQTLTPNAKTTLTLVNGNDEVFDIKPFSNQVEVSLVNLVIEGGGGVTITAGGIRVHSPTGNGFATLNLVNSVVRNNQGLFGGGIRVTHGTVNISGTSSIISNVSDSSGGGISCVAGEVNIENGLVGLNEASTDGGGISLNDCSLNIYGYPGDTSSIAFNTALSASGGGIYATNSSHVKIEGQNASVSLNQAISSIFNVGAGGGIYVEDNSTLELYSAIISNNKSFIGAGLYIGSNSTLDMGRSSTDQCDLARCSRVLNNKAVSGILNSETFAGGIYSVSSAVSNISQTWISGNEADYSSALSIKQGSVKHSMITNNANKSTDGSLFLKSIVVSGPIFDFKFNTLAKNSFLTNNVAVVSVGSQATDVNLAGNIIQENVFVNNPVSVNVSNINSVVNCTDNLLEAATATSFCADSSNLDVGNEAMFVDSANNDFHITPQSLAINHAASVSIALGEKDIDNDFIFIPDAGADETIEPRVGLNGNACSFLTISDALSAANEGDDLYLRPGIYLESNYIGKQVDLIGASNDCTTAIIGTTSNNVIIDGTGVTDNNALLVIQGNKQVALSNLTIQHSARGGISKLSNPSGTPNQQLILTNVTVTTNQSEFNGAGISIGEESVLELRGDTSVSNNFCLTVNSKGGGIFVDTGGIVKLYDNSSVGKINQPNIADNGGGIYINSATIEMHDNSQIIANTAIIGGGLYVQGADSLTDLRSGSSFKFNHAENGGAIYLQNAEFLNSAKFISNTANKHGGAVYIERSVDNTISFLEVDFEMNSSQDAGGAIYVKESDEYFSLFTFHSVSFINNSALNKGGAIFLGAKQALGIFNSFSCQQHVGIGYDYCSQFIGNSTSSVDSEGGAIYNEGFLKIDFTSFKQNNANAGSAIFSKSSDGIIQAGAIIRYSLFAENLGESSLRFTNADIHITGTTLTNNERSLHVLNTNASFSMNKSIIWGDNLSSIFSGQNQGACNIDEFGILSNNTQNPLFGTGISGIPYMLSVNSPAIDVCLGTPSNTSLDLIGNFINSDGNYHASSDEGDMGAFEYIPLGSKVLTVNKTGSGNGTVTSQFGDISCGSSCSDDYPLGLLVTLSATADTNMTFVGWSGASCFGINHCLVHMNQDQTVTAQFISSDIIFKNGFE